ncbi:uncharacterized protein LOC117608407 [Osmia lignaria lignaria]|uniref:uncharacterized protein LOC117608407 n=1 Tax=Osmia lignaria lignaria TaxID=1437193 RepID=UPI00402B8E3A
MNVHRVLLTTLLIISCHNSSSLKNDRGGPSFNNAPNFIRNSRRIELNEYLVPPPPPRPHSLRSGRVANPSPTDAPGYFSKLMNWLNPFNYGVSSPVPPPIETPFQPRSPPQFNLQSGPPLHPPGPLYPPLGPPPNQHPVGIHPGPPINLPPNPLPSYNAPPAIVHNIQPLRNNPAPYVAMNKGKSCNPCNRIPWIPMQGGGLRDDHHPHPQISNGYLPPSNPINHDNHHSASQDISVPSFAQGPPLYPHPVPPSPHFESTLSNPDQQPNIQINGHSNLRGNEDLTSSGTQAGEGRLSAAPQNYGSGTKEPLEYNQPPISGPPDQENQNGGGNHPSVANFGSSNFNENDNGYHEESNVHYVHTQNLDPPPSFGSSNFNDQSNQYPDDLSSSSSIIKDSQIPDNSKDFVHFEESPLLDLTKKDEVHPDTKWSPSTNTYNAEEGFDNILKTTTDYTLETDNIYFEDSSNFIRQSESYSLSDIRNINGALETTTPSSLGYNKNEDVEASTINTPYVNHQSGGQGLLWTNLDLKNESYGNHAYSDSLPRWNNSNDGKKFEKQENLYSKDVVPKQQSVKRNKQVQVVIPYTSEYTPVPFQQSYGDWSVRTNFERSQPRKVPSSNSNSNNIDNYIQQESRNDIQIINSLQSQYHFNDSNKLNVQQVRTSINTVQNNNTKNILPKVSNSIDVRRLQKNIDNWTIQEYSKPTTSNTVLPSSPHPYLLPSKKIPTKYLTTTEPGESIDHNESVKTYSLAGFSFNEVEHEGSASNRIEETRTPVKVLRVETSKTEDSVLESKNKSTTEENTTWKAYSVSVSPVDKERVYVVTPQTDLETSSKNNLKEEKKNETKIDNTNDSNGNFSEFEAIEKAYQVLPQAVNNLAVASTGKENIPLWGIMEHEEFASLNSDDTGEGATGEGLDGPVLYSGHSKVSRAKR